MSEYVIVFLDSIRFDHDLRVIKKAMFLSTDGIWKEDIQDAKVVPAYQGWVIVRNLKKKYPELKKRLTLIPKNDFT